MLIVCPSSLRGNWANEIEFWLDKEWQATMGRKPKVQVIWKGKDAYQPDADFYIISYNSQSRKSI